MRLIDPQASRRKGKASRQAASNRGLYGPISRWVGEISRLLSEAGADGWGAHIRAFFSVDMRSVRHDARARTLLLVRGSLLRNGLMMAVKLALGLLSLSPFVCLNAFYNLCMGFARYLFFIGYSAQRGQFAQRRCYMAIGGLVLLASVLYMLYAVGMLLGARSPAYPRYVALAVAAFTLTELILNIRGSIVAGKNREPLLQALKLTNLSSNLICLVLTQTAILSLAQPARSSFYNGLSGVVLSGAAALIGLGMLLRHRPSKN